MVKIVKAASFGPEIVTLRDLTAAPTLHGPAGALQTATHSVEQMDKWISLADRGVSLLGRLDSIMGKVAVVQGRPPAQQHQQERHYREPPVIMPAQGQGINADLQQQPTGDPAAIPALITPEMAARLQQPPVDITQIIGALDMIAKLQPGLTVQELSDTMKARPDECQRIMDAAVSGKLPGMPNGP
jgi:hypothetical protein